MFATAYKGEYIESFIPQSGLTACFVAIAFFLIFKGFSKVSFSERSQKIIVNVSNNTFGIYLIHALVNSIIFHVVNLKLDFINPIISIPFYSIAVFVISFLLVSVLIRIPIIKNLSYKCFVFSMNKDC